MKHIIYAHLILISLFFHLLFIGSGLFTTKPFEKGDFLVEYRGRHTQADDRDEENTYLFYYKHKGKEMKYVFSQIIRN